MRDRVRHLIEGRITVIREGVASQVITGVVLLSRAAAIRGRLSRGFDAFRSGKQPASGNAYCYEWTVI